MSIFNELKNMFNKKKSGSFMITCSVDELKDIASDSIESDELMLKITGTVGQDSLKKIQKWICNSEFYGKTHLDLSESTGLEKVKNNEFKSRDCFLSLVFPKDMISIGDNAFYGCESLKTVTMSDGLRTIGCNAFDGCTSLSSVSIPESVERIGGFCFKSCNIESFSHKCLEIENGIVVKDGVIKYCSSQKKCLELPAGVTSIGEKAFEYCDSVEEVMIPDGVKSIGSEAFSYCESLKSIVIPSSVIEIGEDAFMECDSLESVKFQGTKAQWKALWDSYNKNDYIGDIVDFDIIECSDGKFE